MRPLLEVRDATVEFENQGRRFRALDRVSIRLDAASVLAVVGESGCGKTTLARAILGLQPLASGEIFVQGKQIRRLEKDLAARVGIVWQDPYASLDPRWRVGDIVGEPFDMLGLPVESERVLEEVGLGAEFARRYPHQLSGGQRQRVAIGRALALRPPLVICDEPTAALDLSVQAQILNLLQDLKDEFNCAYLYISHDLLTVRFLADQIAVMYLGRVVEEGLAEPLFFSPLHPYTKMLLDAAPSIEKIGVLPPLSRDEASDAPRSEVGCPFASRCPRAARICFEADPPWVERGGLRAACHFPLEAA